MNIQETKGGLPNVTPEQTPQDLFIKWLAENICILCNDNEICGDYRFTDCEGRKLAEKLTEDK